jgi:hypothetical protein
MEPDARKRCTTDMKIALAALTVMLTLAAAAHAKGPLHARICGATGCATTLLDGSGFWPDGVGKVPKPLGPAPAITVVLTSPGSGWLHFRYRYLPSLGLLRVDAGNGNTPYWRRAPAHVVQALAPYVRRLGAKP